MSSDLTSRYGRQMRLPGFGEAGQRRLLGARVLLVGAGGLGSPAALYLAAAGVGTLGLADPDGVELSNLHRQILHGAESLGTPKVISAAETLGALNPTVRVVLHGEGLLPSNALDLIRGYDLVVDGADNFPTRFLANDACVLAGKPLVHGSILGSGGQVGLFLPGRGCYRCLYPEMPDPASVPTCGEAGVLGATCGVIGSWMASEALAILLGQRDASRLILAEVGAGTSRCLAIKPDPACPCCGRAPAVRAIDPAAYGPSCAAMTPGSCPLEITVEETRDLLKAGGGVVLLDVREPDELAICRMGATHHIPLGQLGERWGELPTGARILVHCHHGGRSLRATHFLRSKGLSAVSNVKGGVDAWSCRIDPSVPRY
jgi:sulfur-carrier protein adenylyltransferase/sulfurtransferase